MTDQTATPEPEDSTASNSTPLLVCPICNHEGLNEHLDPVKHWGCEKCRNIFIKGAEGVISCFDTALYLSDEEN